MKVLMVSPIMPYPPNQGSKAVYWALLEALSVSDEVTLLCRYLDRDEERFVERLRKRCAEVVPLLAPNRRSLAHRIAYKAAYVVTGLPRGRLKRSFYDCPRSVVRAAEALHRRRGFDLLLVNYWWCSPVAEVLAEVPVRVLLAHDVDHEVAAMAARLGQNPVRRWALGLKRDLIRRRELTSFSSFTHILTLTDSDRDTIGRVVGPGGAERIMTLTHRVDTRAYAPRGPRSASDEILFLGHLRAEFNRDALAFFLDEIFPGVLEERPGARLTVLGGEVSGSWRRNLPAGCLRAPGFVPDPRPYLAETAVLILPLRYAGGLRIRLLEALAMETPVVSTPEGARGSGAAAGRHYLEAAGADAFRAAVVRLLADRGLGESLGREGRAFVERTHGREAARRVTAGLLERLGRAAAAGPPSPLTID